MKKETRGKTYEDFEPELEQLQKDGTDTISISLPDFRKEHIRVQLDGDGYLKISGERHVSGNKWSRFRKEARVPEHCDVNQLRAKLDSGVLYITMPRLATQTSDGTDQTETGAETPKKAERKAKDKDDARPKTAAAAAAGAETQKKKATEPPAASDAPQKAVQTPTKEKAEDAFRRAESTPAASARSAAMDRKQEAEGTPAAAAQKMPQQLEKPTAASAGTGAAVQKERGAAAKDGDMKLPKEESEKAKDGAKTEKKGRAAGERRKPDVAAGDGSLEDGKPRVGKEKQGENGGPILGWDNRKQLAVNVVVASLVVVGLGLYITHKIRSHGNQE